MLNQDEELWEKDLPLTMEKLINTDPVLNPGDVDILNQTQPLTRKKSEIVKYKVPHNGAVQVI